MRDLDDDPIMEMIIKAEVKPKKLPFLSPLYNAINYGSLEMVRSLISSGGNPMEKDINGDSCLHYAAQSGQLEILKYLIEEVGCPAGTEGWFRKNVLHIAADAKDLPMVKYLVEAGLDPNAEDENDCSVIQYACCSGDLELVCYIIEYMTNELHMELEDILYHNSRPTESEIGRRNIYDVSDFTRNPLCCACCFGHLSIVKYFVEDCGYSPTKVKGVQLKAPLESAVFGNHVHIVEYLAQAKHFLIPGDQFVFLATTTASLKTIKYLAEVLNYKFNCREYEMFSGNTPIHLASYSGRIELVRYFFQILKYDPSIKGNKDDQPIHSAASKGQLEVVKYLINEHSISTTALNQYGETPLHLASYYGHMPLVKYLTLELKCNPLATYAECSGSSLHRAASKGQIEIARFFCKSLEM